jgi:hypothetical protein
MVFNIMGKVMKQKGVHPITYYITFELEGRGINGSELGAHSPYHSHNFIQKCKQFIWKMQKRPSRQLSFTSDSWGSLERAIALPPCSPHQQRESHLVPWETVISFFNTFPDDAILLPSLTLPPHVCLCASPLLWNQLGLLSHLIVSHPCQSTMHNTAGVQYNMLRLPTPTATFSLPNFLFPCLSLSSIYIHSQLFPLNI